MSVMLGIVVWMFGFFSTHFRAASIAPSRFSFGYNGSVGFTSRNPPAITFIATTPVPVFASAAMASSIFGSMAKL